MTGGNQTAKLLSVNSPPSHLMKPTYKSIGIIMTATGKYSQQVIHKKIMELSSKTEMLKILVC